MIQQVQQAVHRAKQAVTCGSLDDKAQELLAEKVWPAFEFFTASLDWDAEHQRPAIDLEKFSIDSKSNFT